VIRPKATYRAHRLQTATRQSFLSAAARDIGAIPPMADPARRAACRKSFRRFCETYFCHAFTLAWSTDHLKVIRKIERATLTGGLFAVAMPRGSGKTTLSEYACLWAVLYGHCAFVALIGATAARGEAMLASLKTEIETNEQLLADFPEAVFPVRALERINNRASGQTYQGRPTRIEWTADKIVFPTIAGSSASASIVTATGLEGGAIRGQRHKRPDGSITRPSLVILDDPQTTESAYSELQSRRREAILAGDVLGMAGPGKKIAGILCATIIRPDDMADKILDRKLHPDWQGERTKLVYSFPAATALWDQYATIRAEDLQADGDGSAATDFYRQHRADMDAGAIVAWAERFNSDQLSAVQYAMDLHFRDPRAFAAEYQNEPLPEVETEDLLPAERIAAKQTAIKRGVVPDQATVLTAFIDLHKEVLYWVVIGWEQTGAGQVVDYGTYPDQRRAYFLLRESRRTLSREFPKAGVEAALFAGMERLTDKLLGQEWPRENGDPARIRRCLIDANWGAATDVVYRFCRHSAHAALLLPSHGAFVGANSRPFAEHKRHPGEIIGLNWRVPNVGEKRQIRHVVYDTNWWKTYFHGRLAVPYPDPGCLALCKAKDHRLLADHLTAEEPVRVEGSRRTVLEWRARPNRDNHWLDCAVGATVAASIEGISIAQHAPRQRTVTQARRRRVQPLKA
jgi:hypothetical protein